MLGFPGMSVAHTNGYVSLVIRSRLSLLGSGFTQLTVRLKAAINCSSFTWNSNLSLLNRITAPKFSNKSYLIAASENWVNTKIDESPSVFQFYI